MRPVIVLFLLGLLLMNHRSAHADMRTVSEHRYEMTVLPTAANQPWTQLGGAPVFLLKDGTLFLNDNRGDDRIGYQNLLGEVEADHRVVLTARLKVLSNLDGRGVLMEISRPGLQVALRLFPNRIELQEGDASGRWRWMDAVVVDLSEFREIRLEKASRSEDADETISVWLDGELVLERRPLGRSQLEVGRIVIGAVSVPSMGASIWDWVSYSLMSTATGVPLDSTSLGQLKAMYETSRQLSVDGGVLDTPRLLRRR